ncbi:MAG: hypothetical protein H0X34_16980, partial [Chthoniobacterales bacterium]|nr:hypothetical protein [Chthoniobacterales bacterium]
MQSAKSAVDFLAERVADFTTARLRVETHMPEQDPASDLFDLKMLPAWATETPNENRYADFAGEADVRPGQRERRGGGGERRERGPRPPRRDEARQGRPQ